MHPPEDIAENILKNYIGAHESIIYYQNSMYKLKYLQGKNSINNHFLLFYYDSPYIHL